MASVLYMAERAGIRSRDLVLDAGCGVGGPAMAIATAFDEVVVEGVTISDVQVAVGRRLIEKAGLDQRVHLQCADFHDLPFRGATFDVALYLEVTNYSYDRAQMFAETARVLKPGGRLYVKDLFRPESVSSEQQSDLEDFEEMWACVRVPTLSETIDAIEASGLVAVEVAEYPHLGSNRFIGSMLELGEGGVVPNELGRRFLRVYTDLPVFAREVQAVKPEE